MVDLEAFLGSRIRAGTVEVGATFDLRQLDVVGRRATVTTLEILERTEIEDGALPAEDGTPASIPCFKVRETDPDVHIKEKDLEGHLSNDTIEEKEPDAKEADEGKNAEEPHSQDYQLQRALDLLKTWDIFHKIKGTATAKALVGECRFRGVSFPDSSGSSDLP